MLNSLTIRADGGARGNPGPAGIGVVIEQNGRAVQTLKRFIGKATNNVAEYTALIAGLEIAQNLGARHIRCLLDSQLVVEQMRGRYKVKNADLGKLYVKAWNLVQTFTKVEFIHVPREQNAAADRLVNEAIDHTSVTQ